MKTEKEVDEEERTPVVGEEDEPENERAFSTKISSFSSANELNESNLNCKHFLVDFQYIDGVTTHSTRVTSLKPLAFLIKKRNCIS